MIIIQAACLNAARSALLLSTLFECARLLIVAMATGSGLAGVIVATTAFAAMHRYQGRVGMAATFVGGGLLTALYMGTGALWVPMGVHVLVDLNALVLRPALSARVRRRLSSSAASRS